MGELAIDYSDVKIHTRDYDLQLEGETDISKAVEMMFQSFEIFFEEELTSMLASRFAKTTRDILHDKFLKMNLEENFQTSLVADPVVDSHFIAFISDGVYSELQHVIEPEDENSSESEYQINMPMLLSNDTIPVQT